MAKSIIKQSGITYVEVLVSVVLIAVLLVPAIEGLTPGIQASSINQFNTQAHYILLGKLEMLHTESFNTLDSAATNAGSFTTPTSYSDTSGNSIDHYVYIWRYDVDNADADNDVFTGGEEDLLWLRVALTDDSKSFETLVSRH